MEKHKWKYTAIYILLYGIGCPDIELTLPSYRVISIGQYAGKYKNITLILSIKTAAEKYNVCSPSLSTVLTASQLTEKVK